MHGNLKLFGTQIKVNTCTNFVLGHLKNLKKKEEEKEEEEEEEEAEEGKIGVLAISRMSL